MKNLLILLIFSCSCNGFSIECKINVTKKYVFFDGCYNGLSISQLKVGDSSVKLYPAKYEKVNAYVLLESKNVSNKENLKIYLDKPNENFVWQVYTSIKGHENDSYYSNENYRIVDKIDTLFMPGTWYLFEFYNPHFDVFVFCNNDGDIEYEKRSLNPNF